MLDVAGQDADDFFEDIGHSAEARKEMKKYEIGRYKLDEAAIAAQAQKAKTKANEGKSSFPIIPVILVILLAVGYGYYQTYILGK
jgi:cytochrome b5